jgi:uncharacterized protein (TIGR03000 family)
MFSKYLLAPAVLALGGLLFAPEAVLAQHGHGGGGGGGGGHVSGYHGGGYHGGYGYGGRGYGYGGGYGYGRGYGYGYGGYYPWWGGGYWGGYGPYYGGYYNGDTYVNPNYTTYVQPDTTYVQPDTAYVQPAPQGSDNSAGIRVIVPDPNARVWFDGAATTQTGTDRLFNTPPLSAGTHSYRIRATWTQNGREVTQERTVPIAAGRLSIADFTRPQPEALPTPTTAK